MGGGLLVRDLHGEIRAALILFITSRFNIFNFFIEVM